PPPGGSSGRAMPKEIAIVTPVLDDWESFVTLLRELTARFPAAQTRFHVFAVDDGSHQPFEVDAIALPPDTCVASVEILRLALNLGHQRAIAIGLCNIAHRDEFDAVVVMDSDGEDRPADIAKLLAAAEAQPGRVLMAERSKRSERALFRLGYFAYRLLFHLLTGRSISFGNFSLLPMAA